MDWDRYFELVKLRDSGHVEEAILELAKLGEGAEDRLSEALVLIEIANGLRLLERNSDARRKIAEACQLLGPQHECYPRAAFLAAEVDMDEENWKGALKKLDEILEKYTPVLHTDDHKDLLEKVQQNRGIALTQLKRFREACAVLETLRSVEYERVATLCYLGICEFELGDPEGAKRDFQQMLSLDPNSIFQATAHQYLGVMFLRQGQLARAKFEFERCLACPDRGTLREADLLKWLVDSSNGLNLRDDAARYSEMLKKARTIRSDKI